MEASPLCLSQNKLYLFSLIIIILLYRVYTKDWCGFKSQQEIYFSPYTGTTYTISSGNCPSFSCATSSTLLMLTAGPWGQFPRWRRSRKTLSVCSVLNCPDLWLQCAKLTLHCNHRSGHLKTEHTESLSLLRRHLVNWPRGPTISMKIELLLAHAKLGQLPLLTVYVLPV